MEHMLSTEAIGKSQSQNTPSPGIPTGSIAVAQQNGDEPRNTVTSGLPLTSHTINQQRIVQSSGKPPTYAARMASRMPTQSGYAGSSESSPMPVLDKRNLQDLVKEVDPMEQLDDDVEEVLLQVADDFIDSVVTASAQLAKHRKAGTIEVKDVQLHLERHWNMWIPGFGAEELRPYKKSATTEAHKQRLALIKKTLKKY